MYLKNLVPHYSSILIFKKMSGLETTVWNLHLPLESSILNDHKDKQTDTEVLLM